MPRDRGLSRDAQVYGKRKTTTKTTGVGTPGPLLESPDKKKRQKKRGSGYERARDGGAAPMAVAAAAQAGKVITTTTTVSTTTTFTSTAVPNQTPAVDTESQSSGDCSEGSPLMRHPTLTKGTRLPASESSEEEEEEEKSEFAEQDEKFLELMYAKATTQQRVDFALRIENIASAHRTGVLVNVSTFSQAGAASISNEALSMAFNVCRYFVRSGLNSRDLLKALREACQIGADEARKVISCYKKTCDKVHQSIYTSKVQKKRGTSTHEKQSGKFTYEHLIVLCSILNYCTCYSTPKSADQMAALISHLPPKGLKIEYLVDYLESSVCFENVGSAENKAVCGNSPGPIQVNGQDVRRAIDTINQSSDFEYSFYFGDRTKVKSQGASTSQSQEDKENAKQSFVSSRWANKHFREWTSLDAKPEPNFKINTNYKLPSQTPRHRMVYSDESWVATGMKNDYIWIPVDGQPVEVGNDKGLRLVLIIFVDEDGVDGWENEDMVEKETIMFVPWLINTKRFLKKRLARSISPFLQQLGNQMNIKKPSQQKKKHSLGPVEFTSGKLIVITRIRAIRGRIMLQLKVCGT